MNIVPNSKHTASAVIMMALTESREEEALLKEKFLSEGIIATAVDFGGEFISSVPKIIERAIIASQKAGIINDVHKEEGAVAGAAREAVSQISQKAIGLNVGGKIAVARFEDHLSVCIYFGIGLLNLNEIAIGLGHRAI